MGGSMGNPIDEAAQARINERIEEVVKTFGMEFTKAYTQAVIAKAKEDLSPSSSIEDDLKLQEAPAQSVPLKSGMLTKRGESVKNWKPRFFTIFNEKDNYKVEYRDGTNESGKLKGTIWCAGYRVEEFNSDEIADLGEPGLKLVPWSYRRRTWYMKCADDNERKEWKAAFEVACYKSKPPHDEDECIAEAFNVALRNTRWRFCYWGWYWECGAEPERLGEFLLDVLDRDILDEIIGGIAEGPAKAMTVDLIRKTIGGSVKAACGTAWASSAAAVRSVSEKIQSTVKDLVKPLIEKQNNLKEMIVEKIGGIINPFLENKAGSLFAPILGKIFEPIIKCFCTAAKEFHAFIAAKVNGGDFGKDKFDSVIDRCDWQVDWWSGPIHHAYYIIYNMYTSDLAQLASLFTGGITPYTVYNMVMDKLKTLLHRAVFTFGSLGKSVSAAELLSVLSHVTGLLFHDCCIMIQSTVIEVLKAILSPNLVEAVVTPAKTLIAPLQETIDAIPIPGLSALLDLNQLLDDTVDDITVNALTALTKKSIDKIKSNLDASRVEMGIAQVSLN